MDCNDQRCNCFLQDTFSDDSDFDERIMQQLAAAAASRARYVRGMERRRSSGLAPPQVLVFTSSVNVPDVEQGCTTYPNESQNSSYVSSPTSSRPPAVNSQPSLPMPVVPSVVDMISSTDVNSSLPFKPRYDL